MKVTLLGTGSAEGWPALFCRCDACAAARSRGGKNVRSRSSAIVDGVLKIDFPPDVFYQSLQFGVDLQAVRAVLVTHGHADHFSPAEFQYRGPHFVSDTLKSTLPVYGADDIVHSLRRQGDLRKAGIAAHCLDPWEPAEIAGYQVTPVLAHHDPDYGCFNYLIEDEAGAVLLYATDTGWYDEPTWEFLAGKRIDGAVVECSNGLREGYYDGHLTVSEVIRMRERLIDLGALLPDAPVVTTHMSHLGGLLHEEMEARFAPHSIQTGFDGMVVELSPH